MHIAPCLAVPFAMAILALAATTSPARLDRAAAAPPMGGFYVGVDPLVVRTSVAENVQLRLFTDGTITSASLVLEAGATVALVAQGGGVFAGQITHAQALFGYTSADYLHNFVGFLDAYMGAIRTARLNFFMNVDDGTVPPVAVKALGAGVQASPHLMNVHMTGADPATFDLNAAMRRFYDYFGDNFDFLGVISAPAFANNRHYVGVQNKVHGIGLPIFDNSAFSGSGGRLQGVIVFPIPGLFDLAETGAIHEIGHRWLVFLTDGRLRGGQPHWVLSTLAHGIMGANIPGSNVGGQWAFTITPVAGGYRIDRAAPQRTFMDLELYLMGLAPPSQVRPHLILSDQLQPICDGCAVKGGVTSLTIQDVIAAEGQRTPAFPGAQHIFRYGSIFVTTARPLTAREMAYFDYFAARGESTTPLTYSSGFVSGITLPFALATEGRARLETLLAPRDHRVVIPAVSSGR